MQKATRTSRLHLFALLFPAIFCASCAGAPPVARSRAPLHPETVAAIQAMNACGRASWPTLDDGVSDARTVASAVATACGREYDAATDAFLAFDMADDNDAVRHDFRIARGRPASRADTFVPLVLRWRAEAARPAPQPAPPAATTF